tara:strand:- start:18711 stop:19847 length:1137 start_codon:yes stop_codon:yes gene_type:complete
MNTAIFKSINGVVSLVCSKCGKVIKTEPNFNYIEKSAIAGESTLLPRYCDTHKYMNMVGNEKKREKLRRGIKEKLREGIMKKNVLNVTITRPDQKLVIMRGIPGSGKSTKAKTLVGKGVIHSTDTIIESAGDYNGFFKLMIESKNFSNLSKAHNQNFMNATKSMRMGISPIVIDNTNIKASEPKKYVEEALKLGYNEKNITIVDIADGGVSIEALAERNTHGVPLDKIKKMVSSHKGVGPLTVKKILEANDMYNNPSKVLYSAVVLDGESTDKLLNSLQIPEGWKPFAHHMTIVFGKGLDDKNEIGKTVTLTATKIGVSNLAMAVNVVGYPSANDIPHVTVAVNVAEGGKPYNSNQITNWSPLNPPIKLSGVVQEIKS